MKLCPVCGFSLSDDKFYKSHRAPYGLSYMCKECRRARSKETAYLLRSKVFISLGPNCVSCGNEDHRVLQIDHVNGGGYQHRKETNSGTGYYRDMLNDLSSYQILCANCNWIKKFEENEVPGQT